MDAQKETDEEILKQKARKISIIEGSGYSVMDSFGLRFISPFAVAIGASNNIIAWISSFPGLLSNFVQVFALKKIVKASRRSVVAKSVFFQAIMWLPLILIALFYFNNKISSSFASILLLISYTLMCVVGSVAGPAWNSWMKDILPKEAGAYLAKRNAIVGIFSLFTLLLAGVLLDFFRAEHIIFGFGLLFFIAFLGRAFSAFMFTKQYEPKFVYQESAYFSFVQFAKKMLFNNFGRFVAYTSLMGFSVALASPFISVYMLKDLGFENNYLFYTLVSMSSVVSALISMKFWGKFLDKYGSMKIMSISGFFIALIPLFWFSTYFIFPYFGLSWTFVFILMIIEFSTGFWWAGFNLASGMFVYNAVTRERLAICVAYSGLIGAVFGFLGASIGGLLTRFSIFGLNPLLFVFFLSFVFRLITSFVGMKMVKEVKEVEPFDVTDHITSHLKKLNPLHFLQINFQKLFAPR